MNSFNWDRSFLVDFDLKDGFSETAETTKRYLSQMKDMFCDRKAAEDILAKEDPLVYEFHELGCPERPGDLAFGTTILYPGKIGEEYYFTKGHFHTILETAEVYYTLEGAGYMVMENPEGDCMEMPLSKGRAVYVPRRYAHRTVNTGSTPLVDALFGVKYRLYDYGTIETKGYHRLVVERNGEPAIVSNPNWKRS